MQAVSFQQSALQFLDKTNMYTAVDRLLLACSQRKQINTKTISL